MLLKVNLSDILLDEVLGETLAVVGRDHRKLRLGIKSLWYAHVRLTKLFLVVFIQVVRDEILIILVVLEAGPRLVIMLVLGDRVLLR